MSSPPTPSTSLPSATNPPIAKLHKTKTLIVCFDGTGQQYDTEVNDSRIVFSATSCLSPTFPSHRIQTSSSFSTCLRRTARTSKCATTKQELEHIRVLAYSPLSSPTSQRSWTRHLLGLSLIPYLSIHWLIQYACATYCSPQVPRRTCDGRLPFPHAELCRR